MPKENDASATTLNADPLTDSVQDLYRPTEKTESTPEGDTTADTTQTGKAEGETPENPDAKKAEEDAPENPDDEPEADDKSTDADPTSSAIEADPTILEALKDNPAALKRIKEQFKGVQKIVDRANAKDQTYAVYSEWNKRLDDKALAPAAIREIAQRVANAHGMDVNDLLGGKPAAKKSSADTESETTDDETFDYEGDKKVLDAAVAKSKSIISKEVATASEATKKEILESMGFDPAEVKELLASRKAEKADKTLSEFAESKLPKVAAYIKYEHNGFEVTGKMLADALKANPTMLNQPAAAVTKHFSAEIIKHIKSGGIVKKGAESPASVGRTGTVVKDNPLDETVHDLYAQLKS